jgi:ADP-ribose pyrophosphatase
LAEEAGLCAKHWQTLNTIYPSPGICDERISLYLARKLSPVDIAHEAQEFIERHWVPLPEAIDWIAQGTITDAKTIVALYAAWAHLGNETPAIHQS